MYLTVLPWYLANIKLSHWILLLFVLKECLWCLCYGKKALFLLIVFSLSLFLWLYCLPAAEGPLWCLLWYHGLLCCTVEPMVFLSNQSWHTGWKKTKPKIKLFSNYGYLIKSAFVTAAGVLEISVCKYLYILICFQPQRCFCLSVFLTPGHSCKQPSLPARRAALPREDTSLLPSLSAWYQLHLVPSSHSEGLASKENQISLVSIQPGKRVAQATRTLLLAGLSAEGGWQGVLFVCCPAPPRSLRGPRGHPRSCCGEPDSPVPTGSLTCWLHAPCGSGSAS